MIGFAIKAKYSVHQSIVFSPMMNEPLRSIMTSEVFAVSSDTPLRTVREILLKKGVHHVPVIEGQKLVGLITTWDMFKLGKSAEDYADMQAKEIMTTHLATLSPDDHIGAAAEVFEEHLFQAIPIVNEARELVGLVTTHDLLDYQYNKEYPSDLDKFVEENMH